MASLNFDASTFVPAPDSISVTVAASHMQTRWSDRRSLAFLDFAEWLMKPAIGPKTGTCYTPAVFRLPQRIMDNSEKIDVAVIDADCGHTAEEIVSAVKARGWEAVVHSTFSHLTAETEVACSAYDKWRADSGVDDPAAYMREKKGYLPHVVEGAVIMDVRGTNYIIKHNPCPKFRVVLPLSAPWLAESYATQRGANDQWRVRILALAAALKLHHDQSCTDTSRLFFLPRCKDETALANFIGEYIPGERCNIWSLPDAVEVPADAAPNLFTPRAAQAPRQHAPSTTSDIMFFDGDDSVNLTTWAVSHGPRFEIAKAIKSRAAHLFGARQPGVKRHILCPFDDEHTKANDRTGTFVVNASEISRAGLTNFQAGFYVGCKHNGCAGRDRLAFLSKMLQDGTLTIPDLTSPDFIALQPCDMNPADTKAFLDKIAGKPVPKAPQSIPHHLTENLPGAMGEIHRYMLETAPKPQPILALGATIAAMSAVVGRKVELMLWGTRPNIYCLGIGTTGCGKDRTINAVKDLFQTAGVLDRLAGAEDISSDSGISAEAKEPGKESHVMLIDEVGYLLAATNAKFAPPHLAGVISLLLRLYSSSKSVFKSKSFADPKKKFQIVEPSISMWACSTPDKLFSSMTSADISAGLLSRLVVFDIGYHDIESAPPRRPSNDTPEGAIEWIKNWDNVPVNEKPFQTKGGYMVVAPSVVELTDEAKAEFESFNREMHHKKMATLGSGLEGIYVRANENACKFALIRATATCGFDKASKESKNLTPRNLTVTGECARWAVELSRAVTDHMVGLAHEHIADTPFARNVANFREVIRKGGARGVTLKELIKNKKCQLATRDFEQVISYMTTQSKEIVYINTNEGKTKSNGVPVKQRRAYVWAADANITKKDEDDDEE